MILKCRLTRFDLGAIVRLIIGGGRSKKTLNLPNGLFKKLRDLIFQHDNITRLDRR